MRRAREVGVSLNEARGVVAMPISSDQDVAGRHRFVGEVRGIRLRVVLALDDPFLIVELDELAADAR